MSSYVSAGLRRVVAARADFLCEYCLIHEDDTVFGCEVDHIISTKHGGAAHFRLDGVVIVDLSDIGEVTGRILAFNTSERLLERQVLLEVGRYPNAAALARMTSLA